MHKHSLFVVTDSGCEDACVQEIGRWLKNPCTIERNIITLEGTLDDAVTLGYFLQTARRVCVQLVAPKKTFSPTAPDKNVIEEMLPPNASFKVEAEILALDAEGKGEKETITQELIEEVADWAIDHLNCTVKLHNPDIVVCAAEIDKTYVGIDVIGKSLSKRDWRIMLSRRSLKSTVAAAVVLYSGASEKDTILDPFADDGTIAIEAALLLSKTSPRSFERKFSFEQFPLFKDRDWKAWKKRPQKEMEKIIAYGANLHEMKAIRTNSKLAGIERNIHSTKVEVDWVDAKNDQKSIDRIITAPIPSGKSFSPQQAAKLNDQLFYQAEYVLKKGKTVTVITEKPDELLAHAQKYGFAVTKRIPVLIGLRKMTILIFQNKKVK